MDNQIVQVGDFSITTSLPGDLLKNGPIVINTINAYSWVMTNSNPDFKEALRTSEKLLPDGVAIQIAARMLSGVSIPKIAGADLHFHLLNLLEKMHGRCFYLGSSEETLSRIKERLAVEYPSIEVQTYSPPFKPVFSEEDNRSMINANEEFSPDVLFVGMTAPKQELWISQNRNQISAMVTCGIGAVFDFYAGTKQRPAQWMINCGLEWFGRLLSEPKRMWKRYLVYNCVFLYDLFLRWIGIRGKRTPK